MGSVESTAGSSLDYVQSGRLMGLDSPLGHDNVIVTELRGEDAISSPFRYEIAFATSKSGAEVKKLLGQKVTLWFGRTPDADQRPMNGLVRHLSGPAPGPRGFTVWRAVVVPQLAFLGFTQDCRIFQQQSVLDILRAVFAAHGLDQYEFRGLMGHYTPLDYCVQYRETSLAFVSRLMEQVGLFYWHEFTGTTHTLVITDSNLPAQPALHDPLRLPGQSGFPDVESLTGDYDFRPGKWTLTDYDFTSPTKVLTSDTPTVITEPAMTAYEMFDFPGQYLEPEDVSTQTRLRIEHEEMRFHTLSGTGHRAVFDAGLTVELEAADAGRLDVKGKLLLTAVWHEAADWTFVNSDGPAAYYKNRFEAIPAEHPYRPAQKTPEPTVKGVQCAVVVGPPGEYIYTDEHGRVKVRFFWDRNPFGNPDENRSCWLRVSQAWADGKFGSVHLPRIGQEVIVDFLEGDPDRPIIMGRVYNGDNMHPYDLPASKTQSGFKTQSVPPNGGWNEMRTEDMAGSELFYMRSQKDHTHDVLNDHTHNVGHDHHHNVGNNYNVTIVEEFNISNANATSTTAGTSTETSSIKNESYAIVNEAIGMQNGAIGLHNEATGMQNEVFGLKTEITGAAAAFVGEEFAVKLATQDFGLSKFTNYISGQNIYVNYCNEYVLKFDNCILKIDICDIKMENAPIKEELKGVHFANATVKIGNDVTEMKQNTAFLREAALVLIQ
jgi:type VI secretion system secreted protein VgrG